MLKVLWACVLLLLGAYGACASSMDSAPVKVWLRSSWAASDLLLEIIETVALENSADFFPAFDLLTSPNSGIISTSSSSKRSQKETYDLAIEALQVNAFFAEPNSKASVELSLSLHAAAPKLEAFYEFYKEKFCAGADPTPQGSWVDWHGERLGNLDALKQRLESKHVGIEQPRLLPFDHINPLPLTNTHLSPYTAILYVSFESLDFWDFHKTLYTASQQDSNIQYIIRYKMDYLAVDDRKTAIKDNECTFFRGKEDVNEVPPDEDDQTYLLDALRSFPEFANATEQTRPLDEDELANVGVKATSLIINSTSPFMMLRQISQNFPKYATSIARRVPGPSDDLQSEIMTNGMTISLHGIWINGLHIQDTDLNPFSLIKFLREERRRMLALTTLGLSPAQAVEVISDPAIGHASQPSRGLGEGYFDASDREEGGNTILWWNDIEKDSRYARWSPSLTALMRGMFPGQFLTIRRNLNNIILVVDMSIPASLNFIGGPIAQIISRNLPFRFGVVPMLETGDSRGAARLILYSVKKFGRPKTMGFINALMDLQRETINFAVARAAYDGLVQAYTPLDNQDTEPPLPFDAVVAGGDSTSLAAHLERASQYARRLSTTSASYPRGHGFINGKHYDFNDEFLRAVQMESAVQTEALQEAMYMGELEDDDNRDMSVYFYDLPTTSKRRNMHVYPSTKTGSLKVFSMPELFDQVGIDRTTLDYIYPKTESPVSTTVWVVGNLNERSHLGLLREAILAQNNSASFRLSYLHIPEDLTTSNALSPSSILQRLQRSHRLSASPTSADDILDLLNAIAPAEVYVASPEEQAVIAENSKLHRMLSDAGDAGDSASVRKYTESTLPLRRVLGLEKNDVVLIVNGRVSDTSAELVTMASSIISAANVPDASAQGLFRSPPLSRNRVYRTVEAEFSSFQAGDIQSAMLQIGAILDPLTESAQKLALLLDWLSQLDFSHTQVVLLPMPHTQLPLKRFYRYHLPYSLSFDHLGRLSQSSLAFRGLPPDPIYTLAMDVPQSWLVRPRESPHDLDNIHLASLARQEISHGVEAVFDLDFLVIEGHAREPSNAPPRGVQLQLTDASGSPIADTLVMANLGYLQFRAKPGVFKLGIRPGRGQEVYEMESVGNEGWESLDVRTAGDEVTLISFEGLTLFPRLKRRTGMEVAEVLAPAELQPQSVLTPVFSWLKSRFGASESQDVITIAQQADINIFTVASGLLYERFVGIMILSVLKNTNSTVKFWFIENFLSPSFLEFIPHLASAYNFQFELVTYKWPSWLRAQTEKQRVIWAYKILFLDVLFPMDLKKVIFVDADQIVRADLKELIDLDLEGAPYGYTPMGDDNEAMEGFRFWKTGYWKDFLKGRPYHISALYVIDLVRFRQLAAGDRLRGQYHGLSADPNSLANLDQDLPNNMQHEIPILTHMHTSISGGKDRFDQAKTIDLCQNPLTKEPKLSRARKIPEWEAYDAEVASFARKLVGEGKIHGGAIAASSNDLAGIGAQTPKSLSESEPETREQVTGRNGGHPRDEF
ncbi:UDP-glucose:glycoprotein glucosyltransferase-domain-containing protein [Cantharellus anzutake]|uniref:UDP-glucose:glycoprotein glucosyltransferase-domain-containing protein n=1 Tax=Cantharellus anzutake TaxID=1750568 RepID=UPI0019058929|nr:UDP-glucose:glycoprotein glucosyltransferase-domain-containing protein [Cantharellus anzutake]KAF8342557.1 UDP-glucose:glycoprotein glucosyltransferase-domain-containing protein [Cantharellus anzutake]